MTERKRLIARLDKLWSRQVKERTDYTCEYCGRINVPVDPHHYIGRANLTLRHDLSNGFCLCTRCHRLAEQYPEGFEKFAYWSRGAKWWHYISVKKLLVAPYNLKIIEYGNWDLTKS